MIEIPRSSSSKIIQAIILIIYIAIILGPFFYLGFQTIDDSLSGSIEWQNLISQTNRRLPLILNSFIFSFLVSVGSMTIGLLVSLKAIGWREKHLRVFQCGLFLIFPLPSYLHAFSWMDTIQVVNQLFDQFGIESIKFYGWYASWWVQTLTMLPLAILISLIGLNMVKADLIEASRLLQRDSVTLNKIILPLAWPMILTGTGIIFLFSLVDYTIPSLFQTNVFSLEIFADFSAYHQIARVVWLSLPMLVVGLVSVIGMQAPIKEFILSSSLSSKKLIGPISLNPVVSLLQNIGLMIFASMIVIPILAQVNSISNLRIVISSVVDAYPDVGYSLKVSFFAALLSLILVYPIAHIIIEKKKCSNIWWIGMLLPFAVPASLVGIGLVGFWNHTYSNSIYQSALMPTLASTIRFLPLSGMVLISQLKRIDPSLLEIAELLQSSNIRNWIFVKLPLVLPGLLVGFMLVLIFSLSELGATLMVVPPGKSTLTLKIYNYLHYGASETVAGLSLFVSFMILLIGFSFLFLINKWIGIFPGQYEYDQNK